MKKQSKEQARLLAYTGALLPQALCEIKDILLAENVVLMQYSKEHAILNQMSMMQTISWEDLPHIESMVLDGGRFDMDEENLKWHSDCSQLNEIFIHLMLWQITRPYQKWYVQL